jgi:DNA-binding NarL/FixJ family response regulator
MMLRMGASVLIVDDDPAFRRLAGVMLAAVGLAVVGEAGTAAAALAAAVTLRPDGVLVDVGLPDRDGISLAGELTELPWRPRVLLTSSNAMAASARDVQRSGAEGFVTKEALPDADLDELLGG